MTNRPVALIAGITGQDGAYLAKFLLEKGYEVHGLKRYVSVNNEDRLQIIPPELRAYLHLHTADMTDSVSLIRAVQMLRPDEIYNLAAQSHVHRSFEIPEYTANTDGLGALRLLEAVRLSGRADEIRFYQASTSELFGATRSVTQNEDTPFHPRSPYAVAKLFAHWTARNYREAYGMFAATGILFNHDSPIRGAQFATRKITRGVAAIHLGRQDRITLGTLNARRDWGHAADYVEGMWRILQHSEPDDFVLATGVMRSVREFAEAAFACVDIGIEWRGEGLAETAVCTRTGRTLVDVDARNIPPAEVEHLCGDAGKARRVLGWVPRIPFETTVRDMVATDVALLSEGSSAAGLSVDAHGGE